MNMYWVRWTVLLIFFISAGNSSLHGQQLPLYSQYMFNGLLLNPAVAGIDGYTTINFTVREQWLNFPGAPRTFALCAHGRLMGENFLFGRSQVKSRYTRRFHSGRVGIGGFIFTDRAGIIDRTGMQLIYAYHVSLPKAQLSLGLAANLFQFNIDESKIRLNQEHDKLLLNSQMSLFVPDFNFGIFVTSPTYYAGFSAAQLLNASVQFGEDAGRFYRVERHYFFTAGYSISLGENIHLDPSILFKGSESKATQLDFTMRLFVNNDYFGGVSYRTGANGGAMICMGGVSFKRFNLGYAFDYFLNSLQSYSYGSHEFMAAVRFGDQARLFRWMNRY